jgi:hypothetical protein
LGTSNDDGKGAWREHKPLPGVENEFIRVHRFAEYAKWHLGVDERYAVNTIFECTKCHHKKGRAYPPFLSTGRKKWEDSAAQKMIPDDGESAWKPLPERPFRIRKPPFYPLNYGNSDICDFRFSIAKCKQRG